MEATIKQAEKNDRNLKVEFQGRGHWKISMDFRGKRISTVTTNSIAVDNFNSEFGEKDQSGFNKRKAGYIDLCEEIISKNN